MVFSQIDNHWNKHWEGLVFISLQNVKEVVIFKETHSSISNLKMDTSNTFNDSLEKLRDEMLNSISLTYLQNFLELSQKQCFLNAVSKWPVFQKSLK